MEKQLNEIDGEMKMCVCVGGCRGLCVCACGEGGGGVTGG